MADEQIAKPPMFELAEEILRRKVEIGYCGTQQADIMQTIRLYQQEMMRTVIGVLNEGFKADPNAMHAMIVNRVPCNQAMVDHLHVVCDKSPVLNGDHYQVGMGGILAGICTAAGLPIIATEWGDEVDEDGRKKIVGFCLLNAKGTLRSVEKGESE